MPSTSWAIVLGICTCLSTVAQEGSIPTFGTTVVIPAGLRGDLYYIPSDTTKLPEFHWLKPVGRIYANSLNVPPQSFLQGFPGVTERFEWFAIDYNGRFWIAKPGVYQFALTSDDGAKLYIDGKLTVDNDGIHPPQVKTTKVGLSGGIHGIRVSYFQGPREEVALILQVAGPGEKWRIFSTDEFKPPPNPETWAYSDADQLVAGPDLRLSSVAGAAGEQVSVNVFIESPPRRELVSLEWEVVVPAQLLELVGDGPETGRAAADSGRLVKCSKKKSYLYACVLGGGQKPMLSGPIAVFHFKIRTDAEHKTTALRIDNVYAVTSDGLRSTLNGAEGTVTID